MRCLAQSLPVVLAAAFVAHAAEHRGVVTFGGLPLPGASITASDRNGKKETAISGPDGIYSFPDLASGTWTLRVEMLCFEPAEREVTIAVGAPPAEWEMKLRPLPAIVAQAALREQKPAAPEVAVPNAAPEPPKPARSEEETAELNDRAADGFLINGSANNGGSTLFAISPAFGNFRKGPGSLYNGSIGLIAGNSLWDARSYSLTGQDTPKPSYNRLTGLLAFAGPIRIPHLLRNGPNLMVNYQWTRNRNATTQSGLVPTAAERLGDLGPQGTIPLNQISREAQALLKLYPLPNFRGGSRYNYQVPLTSGMHQDSLQARVNKGLGRRDQMFGSFALQSTRTDNTNLFGFLDTGDTTGLNVAVDWRHSLTPRLSMTLGAQFSRLNARVTPYFAGQTNVSGEAGIAGNSQAPVDWGPPALTFSSGISGLSDMNPSFTRNQTTGGSIGAFLGIGRHGLTFGGDVRRQQFNLLAQQDPRGAFTFTGAADFAGFLLGRPDTASLAFGNADKYLRAWFNDAYFTDDWRLSPGFTLNSGVRWEYGSPVTERYNRLVNLDIASGFGTLAPVVATDPSGSVTGRAYPASLVEPDRLGIQPRIGFSWRPLLASSLVVRGGYGVYYNTSVYQILATQMAQQPPLSKTLSVQSTLSAPLTLADGFNTAAPSTANTFAIDPDFQIGYSQNWQLSVQRDLPAALVMIATYSGGKGTRGVQVFLPNTFPTGAIDPCPACPRGFAYVASNGNSTRESGQIQLRRRLRAGASGSLQYTYAKSIDNSALGGRGQGGSVIAQNWLDLRGERGRSNFDQRHAITAQFQYTSGMGTRGGLLGRRVGSLLREWTLAGQITAGTGLPLTPVYLTPVKGTGVTGSIRPDYNGAPLYDAPSGLFLNPAAYDAPALGHWGNAGRNSITGPAQFVMDASVGRTFRYGDRVNLDFRIDAANALNQVSYTSWNTTVGGAQFGFPTAANPMRTLQTTVRVRF